MTVDGLTFPKEKLKDFERIQSLVKKYNQALDELEKLGQELDFDIGNEYDGHVWIDYNEECGNLFVGTNF